jgi:hypothetical protein
MLETAICDVTWCVWHELDSDGTGTCHAELIEIDEKTSVDLRGDDEATLVWVIDPQRGLHKYDTLGQYTLDEAEAIATAMLEMVRRARADVQSASANAHCTAGCIL